MTPRRLPSRPLLALVCLALSAPVAASAADPTPAPVAAPSNPAPVAATPAQPSPPPAAPSSTYTPSRTYTAPVTVAPSGPTAAQRAAAQLAAARKAAARRARHQMQLLTAAQTHTEAVLRAELDAARGSNEVDLLAGSVAESIGAAPASGLPSAAAAPADGGSGGGASIPLAALVLAACAGLLGLAAAFASRRGVGFATAALPVLALLLAGI